MPWIHRPEVLYWMEAQRLTEELESRGILLDWDQAQALARAQLGPARYWVDQEPVLDHETSLILDQLVAEWDAAAAARGGVQVQDLAQAQARTAPDPRNRHARRSGHSRQEGHGDGQGVHAERDQPEIKQSKQPIRDLPGEEWTS
jgi:hypothetical protein